MLSSLPMTTINPPMTTTEPVTIQANTSSNTTTTTTTAIGPTVFVGNLAFSTTDEQITELFGAEKV